MPRLRLPARLAPLAAELAYRCLLLAVLVVGAALQRASHQQAEQATQQCAQAVLAADRARVEVAAARATPAP
jgi:hypothetical protein